MQKIIRNRQNWGMSLLVIFLIVIVWCFGIRTPAYSVCIDGQKALVVTNKADVSTALNQMQDEEMGKRVDVNRTFAKRGDVLPAEKVALELKLALQPKVMAASLIINGEPTVHVQDKATAEALLEKLKQENTSLAEGEKLLSMGFEEDVQITEGMVIADKVSDWDDAWNLIKIGTASPQIYNVKEGDCLWTIARAHDMYISEIVQTNNIQEDAILALGQSIILNKSTPLISVVANVEGTENVAIPYQTKTENSNSISGIKVKTEGQNGEKFIAYTATIRNGILEKKDILEEKIIKEAVDKVIVKGPRATQLASRSGSSGGVSTGRLNWPVSGSISQSYGGRHTGLDIAGSSGTRIVAADGGVVTFTGWQGNYGNLVIISHGNGLVTRYAHCSSISVSSGQRVSQGQKIATRGSTGHSTGPHLHFEVMQNGSFRNPINYLR